jgi:hypothetical protein
MVIITCALKMDVRGLKEITFNKTVQQFSEIKYLGLTSTRG